MGPAPMEDKRILLGVVDECFEVISASRIAALMMNMRCRGLGGPATQRSISLI